MLQKQEVLIIIHFIRNMFLICRVCYLVPHLFLVLSALADESRTRWLGSSSDHVTPECGVKVFMVGIGWLVVEAVQP